MARPAHSANTATFWLSFRAGVAFTRDGGESRTLLAEAAAAVQQAKAQGGGGADMVGMQMGLEHIGQAIAEFIEHAEIE